MSITPPPPVATPLVLPNSEQWMIGFFTLFMSLLGLIHTRAAKIRFILDIEKSFSSLWISFKGGNVSVERLPKMMSSKLGEGGGITIHGGCATILYF